MTIQEFIQSAVEGGWENPLPYVVPNEPSEKEYGHIMTELMWHRFFPIVAMDCNAWIAVGMSRGWNKVDNVADWKDGIPTWANKMRCLTDALIEGKTIEDYLKTL